MFKNVCQTLIFIFAIPASQWYGIENFKVPKTGKISVSVKKLFTYIFKLLEKI